MGFKKFFHVAMYLSLRSVLAPRKFSLCPWCLFGWAFVVFKDDFEVRRERIDAFEERRDRVRGARLGGSLALPSLALPSLALLALVCQLPVSLGADELRGNWVDQSGKYRVEAEFVRLVGQHVTLRKSDGVEVTLPLSRLNAESRNRARELTPRGEVLFQPYRPQTGIEGVPFEGPRPMLSRSAPEAVFCLDRGPDGLNVDEKTGVPRWNRPAKGRHVVRIKVMEGRHMDIVEWILHIVPRYADDVVVYSTEHVDFVMTERQVKDNLYLKRKRLIDAEWETYAALVGQEPINDRQIYLWTPGTNGARAGNPAIVGGTGDAEPLAPHEDWERWGYAHEMGHNFNYLLRTPGTWSPVKESEGFNVTWLDRYFHHLTAINTAYVWLRIEENPRQSGLSRLEAQQFRAWRESGIFGRDKERQRSVEMKKQLSAGKSIEEIEGIDIVSYLSSEIASRHGTCALCDALRLMRHDVLPAEALNDADTTMRKFTALLCILSTGARHDLRPLFGEFGFRVEEGYYSKVLPIVEGAAKRLPREEEWRDGWVKSLVNGHFYRVMRWKTDWEQANRTAKQWGGRLLQIESAEEQAWVQNRFGHLCPSWLGLKDDVVSGEWKWTTGQKLSYANWNPHDRPPNRNGFHGVLGASEPRGIWKKRFANEPTDHTVIVERDY